MISHARLFSWLFRVVRPAGVLLLLGLSGSVSSPLSAPPPATRYNLWIAPAKAIDPKTGAANYSVGTNWSLGRHPNAGETALFDPNAVSNGEQGTNTPCIITAGENLPTLDGLILNDWGVPDDPKQAGTLTINSDLPADTITINARTKNAGKDEIILNSGGHLYALQRLTWAGGSVTGTGTLEVGGTDSINGTSAADKPTLGVVMNVGTSFNNIPVAGYLTFSKTTQPLVVKDNANIKVNSESSLYFNVQAPPDRKSATAILSTDKLAHSIIVNGGDVARCNVCALLVCMGLRVKKGQVKIYNPRGRTKGNPIQFTGKNSDGSGMDVNGGSVDLSGDIDVDAGGIISNGNLTLSAEATLNLGKDVNSPWSELIGGSLMLQGRLNAHGGGFYMDGGTLHSAAASTAIIALDTGSTFEIYAGEIVLTNPAKQKAFGTLSLQGNFFTDRGQIVGKVDSRKGQYSVFNIRGNAALSTDTIFSSLDVNENAKNVNKDWRLITVSGNRRGDFTYRLPPNWTPGWSEGHMVIHEP
ncbi:MAG TPA: hypothetical protein VH643_23420 [Gemmataceae bacterium]|jgi:adhesin HecA-like repeat protein